MRVRSTLIPVSGSMKEDLALVRVLAEPRDVGAAVDHALLHLDDDAHLRAVTRRVAHRDLALKRRRHEG
eukprot:5152444-Prymnesium_polylepis.1